MQQKKIFIRNFLSELLENIEPISLLNDGQSAQEIVNNTCHHRIKHIDINHHFIKGMVKKNLIKIEYKNRN